jgi:hypothetical protein
MEKRSNYQEVNPLILRDSLLGSRVKGLRWAGKKPEFCDAASLREEGRVERNFNILRQAVPILSKIRFF